MAATPIAPSRSPESIVKIREHKGTKIHRVFLSLMLSSILILSMFPLQAFAEIQAAIGEKVDVSGLSNAARSGLANNVVGLHNTYYLEDGSLESCPDDTDSRQIESRDSLNLPIDGSELGDEGEDPSDEQSQSQAAYSEAKIREDESLGGVVVASTSYVSPADFSFDPIAAIDFNGNTYALFPKHPYISWEQAKSECEQMGGHMLTITSENEEAAVDELLQYVISSYDQDYIIWLGIQYLNGSWSWITGEPYQYSNLYILPGGLENGYVAAKSAYSGWWSTNPDPGQSYICEWETIYHFPQLEQHYPTTETETFWADPVDVSTGAQSTALSYLDQSAYISFSLELNYRSDRLTPGEMGRGWHHNYEKRIKETENGFRYYSSPSSYIEFEQSNIYRVYETAALGRKGWTLNDLTNFNNTYMINCNHDEKLYFDADGYLIRIENRVGDALSVSRSGNCTTIEDSSTGKKLVLNRNSSGLLVSAETRYKTANNDAVSASMSFVYDSADDLVAFTDPCGYTTTYAYDNGGRMTSSVDGDNTLYLTNTYDSEGRVATQSDGEGGITSFEYIRYNNGTRKTIVTDRRGGMAAFDFNENKLPIKMIDQDGVETTYSYDSNGNKLTENDGMGNTTTWTYDATGRVLTECDPR